MGLYALVRTRQYRNFMAKLYGLGASVVIIGALFKINHYMGADYMLIVGLGTESLIFFFSAFEPPHVEPDWSLVYPQLAGIYHEGDNGAPEFQKTGSGTQELDRMLEKAKIGPELIESLGAGLRNLTETTSKLTDVSNAAVANDKFVSTMKSATESASVLNDSYIKSAKSIDQNLAASVEHTSSIQSVSKSAAALSSAYGQVSDSIKEELVQNKEFAASLIKATASTNKFVEKYSESADLISKTSEALHAGLTEESNYNKQIQKISNNLSALNALYELHLQTSHEQMESTGKVNETLNKLTVKLNESLEKTTEFKEEVESFSKNIAALNKVYGNMLSAMSLGNR
ncbi:MAG: gliding motility protein GldL [Bacteroidetes bacterium]|nr:gliding motility protein GldL [Bacteroidota bacterium]